MAQSKEEQVAKNRECRKRNGGKYNAGLGAISQDPVYGEMDNKKPQKRLLLGFRERWFSCRVSDIVRQL